MITDDYNKTLGMLDSIRARCVLWHPSRCRLYPLVHTRIVAYILKFTLQPHHLRAAASAPCRRTKFVCVNDDMKEAPPTVQQILRDFYDSFFQQQCPMELPAGTVNPHLYIKPLKAYHQARRVIIWTSVACSLLIVIGVAAMAADRYCDEEGRWKGGAGGSSRGGGHRAPDAGNSNAAALAGSKKDDGDRQAAVASGVAAQPTQPAAAAAKQLQVNAQKGGKGH